MPPAKARNMAPLAMGAGPEAGACELMLCIKVC